MPGTPQDGTRSEKVECQPPNSRNQPVQALKYKVPNRASPRRSTGTRIKIGYDDPTLTGHAGLLLPGELVRRLEVVETIE